MEFDVRCFPKFWKDIKDLSNHHIKALKPEFQLPDNDLDINKVENIKLLDTTFVYIKNSFKCSSKNHISLDRQPFLASENFEIWKLDIAVDNKGVSGGLRFVYGITSSEDIVKLHFILVKLKKDCEKETQLENEVFLRIQNYFKL